MMFFNLSAQGIKSILGDGSETNPYLIRTPEQLAAMRDNVNSKTGNYRTAYYIQTADIDLNSIDNWTPIGTNERRFAGNYNGNGYSIYNLKCEAASAGFFGYASGTIRNIRVKNGLIVGINNTGSAFAGGICGNIFGALVIGCISDTVIKTNQSGTRNGYASGIVGMALETIENNIIDCINLSAVSTEGDTTGVLVIASGICRRSTVAGVPLNIIRCLNAGIITNTTVNGVTNAISSNATSITNCYFDNQTSIATNATATGRTTANCQGTDALSNANKLSNLGNGWIATVGYPLPARFITRL